MWKTFVASPVVGALASLLGWAGANIVVETMDSSTFASLQFGWPGLLIGATALAAFLLILVSGKATEPLVAALCAAAGVALFWDLRELPFSTQNFEQGTPTIYWLTVTMMVVVFALLLVGLRAARGTSGRAR